MSRLALCTALMVLVYQCASAGASGPPEVPFTTLNPEWMTASLPMAQAYLDTPALDHLRKGHVGNLDASEVGFNAAAGITNGSHVTLARCSHTIRMQLSDGGWLPQKPLLKACHHRNLDLLFTLEPGPDVVLDPNGPNSTASGLSSVNSRLFTFAAALRQRGHHITIAGPEDLGQLDLEKPQFDAIIIVKTLGKAFARLQSTGVPMIWDHVDSWDDLPLYQLDLWKLKDVFAGVFTGSRLLSAAFTWAGVPNAILYHQHNNYGSFHRPDRSPPVKVLSLQGDFRTDDLDIFADLEAYCRRNKLEFRHGKYTGHGRDVAELSAVVAPEAQDWGDQLKFCMGMSSVDVAVLWPKNYGQYDVCYKPTSRLSQFASLGIPVVTYPFSSYLDLLVEFGYPFVAQTLPELEQMLDRLRVSPALRQEASQIMLRIGEALSVEELVQDYERGLCHILDAVADKAKSSGATAEKRSGSK